MFEYKFFKCHIASSDVDKGGAPLLQGKGVFAKIFSEDSLKKKKFLLAHTPKQLVFYHEYALPPQNDGYVILVANSRVREWQENLFEKKTVADHPYVYMVVDATTDEPLVAIEECKLCKKAAEEVRLVLEYSLNRDMEASGCKVTLTEYQPTEDDIAKVQDLTKDINDPQNVNRTLETKYGLEKTDFLIRDYLEYRQKATKPKKTNNFRDYIRHKNKNLVIALIHQVIKETKELVSKSVSRIFRFLKDHKVLVEPKFKAVMLEFPELEGHVSVGRYNAYVRQMDEPFKNDPECDVLYEKFEILLKK